MFETHAAVTSSGVRKDYSKFLFGSILRSSDEVSLFPVQSQACLEYW